ncbi:MAG: pilus assembly protein [Firmicutes bacterium]|nr:pilus assembly protein [Bacillota bacterium]
METLIILPLLIALIAGVSWVGLMGRTKIILTIATREGARIAAQGEKAAAVSLVRKLCVENLPFPAGEVRVRVIPSLTAVTVRGEVEVKGLFQSDDRQYLVTASTSMPRTIFSF